LRHFKLYKRTETEFSRQLFTNILQLRLKSKLYITLI